MARLAAAAVAVTHGVSWFFNWRFYMIHDVIYLSHLDSISIKLVQAGEYQNQVGAGTVMVLHDHLQDSKQISEPKRISIEESFIISYLLCFMAISKSPNLRSDGVVGRRWNHHIKLDDIFIASYHKHQPQPEEGSWL